MGGPNNPKQPLIEAASNLAGRFIKRPAALGLIALAGLGAGASTAEADAPTTSAPIEVETPGPIITDCAPLEVGISDTFPKLFNANFLVPQLDPAYVRFPIPRKPNKSTDDAYNAAIDAGVTPVIVGFGWSNKPDTAVGFANKVAKYARRYPEAVIGTLNEPNLFSKDGVLVPDRAGMNPERAAAYIVKAVEAVEEVDRETPGRYTEILGPEVGPVGDGWVDYFRRVYGDLPPEILERVTVALHVYLYGDPEERPAELQEILDLAHEYGSNVDITEMDVIKGLEGHRNKAEVNRQAISVAAGEGVGMLLFNTVKSIEDHGQVGPISTAIEDSAAVACG